MRPLRRVELPVDTTELARFLVGKTLVRETPAGRMSGRIVETEAYLIGDAAAHSFRGMTERNRSLFLERGHAYVYFIYGVWHCMNVSGETAEVGGGVLLRALEPLEGIDLMRRNREVERPVPRALVRARPSDRPLSVRGTVRSTPKDKAAHRIASGPGCLAAALAIDRRCDGLDLCRKGPLWLAPPAAGFAGCSPARERRDPHVVLGNSVRIGLTKEAHRLLRYYERGNPCVSGPARLRA